MCPLKCQLSSVFENTKVDEAVRANKVIKKVLNNQVTLKYPKLDHNTNFIECYSDASYGNMADGGSQGGYVIFLSDMDGARCAITWQ